MRENDVPTGPTNKSKKRKSAKRTPTPATRRLPTSRVPARATKKAKVAKPNVDLFNVDNIELDGEDSHEVPVYDTCDTIRRKIRAHLKRDRVTQAGFLRAITSAAIFDGRKIKPLR